GVRAAALDGDGDPATRRRELERVADEVEDDLPQSLWVAQDGKGVLAVGRERDSLLLGLGAERFDRGFDELGEVEGPRLDRELAGHDARDVEELLDEAHLLPRVALDRLEAAAQGLRVEGAREKELRPAQDRLERRSQLVREHGEKLVLGARFGL